MRILTPWTQQPQVPVEIDWANPLLAWADDVFIPVGGKWLKYSRPGSVLTTKTSNELSTLVSKAGVGIIENPSSYGTTYARSAAYATSSVTLLAVVTPKYSAQTKQVICGVEGYYDDGFYLAITYEAWSCRANIGGNVEIFGSSVEYGKPSTISMSWNGQNLSLKNPSGSYNSSSSSGTLAATSVPFSIGGTPNNYNNTSASATHLVVSGRRHASDSVRNQLHDNPWQIFKPIPRYIFAPVSAATGDGTGIGSLYAITLSSPTATAAGTANATATGSLAASTLTAPTGSASAGTSATATGTFAASSLSAPSATATGSALATGALTTVTLTTITASANGSALATGTIDQIDLSTVAGNATGTTAGNAEGVGSVATIALSAPAASAIGSALATGSFAAISLGTVSGSASAATDGQAAASIQPISISAPLAIAIASSVATGGIQSIGLTAPTGTASGQAQTIARPTSDISNTGWTPSTGSDLYAMLDEVSPDDADYISTSSVGAVCKFGMNATAFPGGASQQLSLRASSSTGNGILVTIKDGATTIATRTLTLTPTFDLHTITLTSGEIAAITSGNLTVEMTST